MKCGIYHLIRTPYGKYIYDANRNLIINDEIIYDYLNNPTTCRDGAEAEFRIKELNEDSILMDEYPVHIEHNDSENIDYYLDSKVNSITLQLTQRCNFRCTYCIYSEDSSQYQRNHSDSDMSIELAEKSVDFLFDHSRDINEVNIGFYGGEPLLKFDVIKHIVAYVKENYYGKAVNYSITTNGSLLSDEVVTFLEENGIYPMISFDGPKEIHDKFRHYMKNGQGTYDTIINRLNQMKNEHYDFFCKLRFSTVVDPQSDLACINNVLTSYMRDYNICSLISLLSDSYSPSRLYIPTSYSDINNDERVKTFLYGLNYVEDGMVSPVTMGLIEAVCRLSDSFKEEHSFKLQHAPGGPCIPGTIRLFINTNGVFYPCEHVSEKSNMMQIGDIQHGFDKEKVKNLLNVAQLTESNCSNCWAYHHCYQCAKFCDNMESLSPKMRLQECKNVRKTLDENLRYYLMIIELLERKNHATGRKENCRFPV